MPSQITEYKCPACTGPLHFVGQSGKLECDYCGQSYDVAEIETLYAGQEEDAKTAFHEAEAKNQSELKSALSAAATNAAQNLSSNFNKTCTLSELNFGGAGYYHARLANDDAAAKISAPELKSKSLKASADAKYICK